jgi:hypothetical protein
VFSVSESPALSVLQWQRPRSQRRKGFLRTFTCAVREGEEREACATSAGWQRSRLAADARLEGQLLRARPQHPMVARCPGRLDRVNELSVKHRNSQTLSVPEKLAVILEGHLNLRAAPPLVSISAGGRVRNVI